MPLTRGLDKSEVSMSFDENLVLAGGSRLVFKIGLECMLCDAGFRIGDGSTGCALAGTSAHLKCTRLLRKDRASGAWKECGA